MQYEIVVGDQIVSDLAAALLAALASFGSMANNSGNQQGMNNGGNNNQGGQQMSTALLSVCSFFSCIPFMFGALARLHNHLIFRVAVIQGWIF